jgi:hypothetical protein
VRKLGIAFGFGLVLFGQVVFAMNSPKPHPDPLQTTSVTHERNEENPL